MKRFLEPEVVATIVAREFKDGDVVNIGVGAISSLVRNYMLSDIRVVWHAENGAVNYGHLLSDDDADKIDPDYIDAGVHFFLPEPGVSFVDHATSFMLVRSGRLDIAVLGAFEVSERGDLASWTLDTEALTGGIGGSMDIATGAKRLIVTMSHVTKDGHPKIVKECSLPLTAKECVKTIITDLAVIDVTSEGLLLREIAPGWNEAEIQERTEPTLIISKATKEIEL